MMHSVGSNPTVGTLGCHTHRGNLWHTRPLMLVDELSAPAPTIDADGCEANLTAMNAVHQDARLHPHVKAHKTTAIAVGDRIRVVPAHIDPTMAMHEAAWLVRSDEVLERLAIDLRGWD